MEQSFTVRWRRASRAARAAVVTNATAPAAMFTLSLLYCWLLVSPVDPSRSTAHGGLRRLFELVARNPDPLIRAAIDVPFALFFATAGYLLLRSVTAPFALDRWKPPVEDVSKQDRIGQA